MSPGNNHNTTTWWQVMWLGNKPECYSFLRPPPPSPLPLIRFHLKFFVKCNQNCLKNAGNPKDSRRRFQVALYYYQMNGTPIGCSESMFVHNNSKHGRRQPPFREPFVGDGTFHCYVAIFHIIMHVCNYIPKSISGVIHLTYTL